MVLLQQCILVYIRTYWSFIYDPQANFDTKHSPKGKSPWIEYNGMAIGDSQLIIEFLEKEFNIDMNSHLSTEEKGMAWSIQKWLEEWTYWYSFCYFYIRSVIFIFVLLS